jgi:alpha-1,2-mannosyltransferase
MTIFFLNRKQQDVAGILLGMSLALKLFPFLLVLYFLVIRKIRIVYVAVVFLLLLYGVTFIIVGVDFHEFFLKSVVPGIGSSYQSDYYNQSLTGFFARLPLSVELGSIVKNLLGVGLILLTFVVIMRSTMKNLNGIVALTSVLTLSLIVNPFSWQHHFVWLIPPLIASYYTFTVKNDKILLAIAYILVAWNFPAPDTVPVLVRSHVLFGTILLWFLQMKFLFRKNV